MSDEKHSLQRQADRAKPGSKRSVLVYLVILFAAAFILLLLSYFMQQRNNEATLSGLRESISSFESLDELMDENKNLREQLDQAQSEAEDLQEQLNSANRQNEELQDSYQKYVAYTSALSTLCTAEQKISERNYEDAVALLTDWDPAYLSSVIAQYDAQTEENGNDGLLLQPRYEALVSTLVQKGYLEEAYSEQFQANN